MMREVVADKTVYEVIAMVVAGPLVQNEFVPRRIARSLQQVWAKLFLKKLVIQPLVYEQGQTLPGVFDQFDGIVLLPGLAIIAQVGRESFLSPWHLRWRHDGRKCGCALVASGISQGDHQSAMPSHGVT